MATVAERAARLAQAESDWTSAGEAYDIDDAKLHPARAAEQQRQRKEEAARMAARDELARKARAQQMQYDETNRALIDRVIGQDDAVERVGALIAERTTAVNDLRTERGRVVVQLRALEQNAVIDLSTVSMGELLKTAASRERARSQEMGALIAVRDELGRRLADAEASLAEAQHEWLRLRRLALHKHCDLLIEQLRAPLDVAAGLLTELRLTENAVREMGGPRQYFGPRHLQEAVTHAIEFWDRELRDLVTLSEQYER